MQRRWSTLLSFVTFNVNIVKAVDIDKDNMKKGNELRKFIVACNSIFDANR